MIEPIGATLALLLCTHTQIPKEAVPGPGWARICSQDLNDEIEAKLMKVEKGNRIERARGARELQGLIRRAQREKKNPPALNGATSILMKVLRESSNTPHEVEVPINVSSALAALGRRAVNEIATALEEKGNATKHEFRLYLVKALGKMGKTGAIAIPILIKIMTTPLTKEHEDPMRVMPPRTLRTAAVAALASIGLESNQIKLVIASYTEILDDSKSPQVVGAVAHALGQFPKEVIRSKLGKSTIPHLIDALDREGPFTRSSVTYAIANYASKAKDVIPQLKPAIPKIIKDLGKTNEKDNTPIDSHAVRALANMGKVAVPQLTKLVGDEGSPDEPRIRAAYVLSAIGRDAKASISTLKKLSKGDNWKLKEAAIKALKLIQRK